MPFPLFQKIISEAKGYIEFAILHLFGEPLLNPNILRMIDFAEINGIRTLMSTNATKLDQTTGQELLNGQLSFLQVCMDGASPETYERIRVGAEFSAVLTNIKAFAELLRARPQRKLKAAIQMIDMQPLRSEREAFHDFWKNEGFDAIFVKPFHVWANQRQDLVAIAPFVQPRSQGGAACFLPWSSLTILSDGTVVPCCNDYDGQQVLGNVADQSLEDIWNGEEIRRLRRMFADPDSDRQGSICANCPVPEVSGDIAAAGMGPFQPKSRWTSELGFPE